MKVSDVIAKYLASQGVTVIFGYQGGAITHMIDSFDRMGITYIQNYNEQGSALAADSYARVSGLGLGVAIGTNGPGATNMITGIANAYCDSIPVLYLTGQVHTFAMKRDDRIRQESFQEIDIISMVRPITKYAVTVMDKNEILPHLARAIELAKEGRPGPVLVDLPVDVQGQDLDIDPDTDFSSFVPRKHLSPDSSAPAQAPSAQETADLKAAAQLLASARRPLVIAGAGIRASGAAGRFAEFVHRQHLPVVASLLGLDALDHEAAEFVGYIGSYGNRYANLAVQDADVILILGSRLDMRQTGKRRDLFAPKAKLIHVDIDPVELGHFVREDISICADADTFLKAMQQLMPSGEAMQQLTQDSAASRAAALREWWERIAGWKAAYPSVGEQQSSEASITNPNQIMAMLGKHLPAGAIVCGDVGQNQMWLAQSLRAKSARILNSGGLGTMGYALPASIGACYGAPDASAVVAVMGDGGLQMNIQELEVIGQYRLPVMVIVMNNHALGLIRDVHEKYYNSRYVGSVEGFSMPELKHLAEAYHLDYYRADTEGAFGEIAARIPCEKPCLVEVVIDGSTYVRPELLGNDGLDHQYPYTDK